jgi:2-oxoglutarate ferredoxin oxidoreductase subunit alpha
VQRLKTDVKEGVDYHPYLPRDDGRLPMSDFGGVHRYNVTGLYHDMWGFPSDNPKVVHGLTRHLIDKIENNVNDLAHYKEYCLEDAELVLVAYGSSARSALHVAENLWARGAHIGMLELQTLWPFPGDIIARKCRRAKLVAVVEMNSGQMCQMVRSALPDPDRVFLVNRIDGALITPTDIKAQLRVISGRGM